MSDLLSQLKERFLKHPERHPSLQWDRVEALIFANSQVGRALGWMEQTSGEPDVIEFPDASGHICFCDCAQESPKGRRSLCYDQAALDARKEHKPVAGAVQWAMEQGLELMDEAQYHFLQTVGKFDLKTSSWLKTPNEVRQLGGAIFGDRRFDRVFIYHNGAESYYGSRGFRTVLRFHESHS